MNVMSENKEIKLEQQKQGEEDGGIPDEEPILYASVLKSNKSSNKIQIFSFLASSLLALETIGLCENIELLSLSYPLHEIGACVCVCVCVLWNLKQHQ